MKHRSSSLDGDRLGLAALQRQIGNQAVQRLLAQANKQANPRQDPQAQIEAGQVKVEKPRLEYHDVGGSSLAEVSAQLPPEGHWYEYEYRYTPQIKNGVVTRVDVTVVIILHLPRWVSGWEQASDLDKARWLELLQSLEADQPAYEDKTALPQRWLGLDGAKAPQGAKGEWQGMLQTLYNREEKHLDIIQRRALVLQQRLLNQPGMQVKAIFDQFMKDVKLEEETYDRQTKLGRKQKVTLSPSVMVQ